MDNLRFPVDVHETNPINLAFLGDGILEFLVRKRLVTTHRYSPAKMHSEAVRFVSAKGQFIAYNKIAHILTEDEQKAFHRGMNATKASVPKHASVEEYRCSTGMEALFGWLFFMRRTDRIEELFDALWNAIEDEEN